MEDRLRRSAGFWRGVAQGAMLLGVGGAASIAVIAARGSSGQKFNAGVFLVILLPSVLGLMLSLGFFFMLAGLMEGIAELIRLSSGAASESSGVPSGTGGAVASLRQSQQAVEPGHQWRVSVPLVSLWNSPGVAAL